MSDTPMDDDDGVTLSAEIMDREERKALKEKEKAEEEANKVERSQEEIEAALAQSKMVAAEKAKRKKIFKYGLIVAFIGLFSWGMYYLLAPFKAGMTFGICKTFLELEMQFPQNMRVSIVEDFGQYVRIWYTQVDAFGEYRMENIQCHFRSDEVTGAAVERVAINRREVDQARVDDFNRSIAVILQNPPDLTIPPPLPDSLSGLQINADRFRFQLNLLPARN